MIGKKFNRLLVMEEASHHKFIHYRCLCDCGKETIVKGSRLRNGSTSSCGCRSLEVALSKIPKMITKSTKYQPLKSIQIKVWKKHYDDDGLSFEDFLKLSQKNCHYCNSPPYNHLKWKDAIFSYNGLDRLDCSLGHTLDNCVPCCIICNRGKSNQSYQQAIEWMRNLARSFKKDREKKWTKVNLDNEELSHARTIFRQKRRARTDLSFEEFYQLSKQNCHYCLMGFSNQYGNFVYNGLDRQDSSIGYLKGNVVPCCKWCNSAKKNLTLNQFEEWVTRLRIFTPTLLVPP